MKKRNREGQSLGDAMNELLGKGPLQRGLDKVDAERAWEQVMGKAIAGYTTSVRLDGKTLYVALSSSVLREELSYGKEKIVRLLNEELGKPLIENLIWR
jgi:predicted nucleic acid-binding Zn ribbon protein